MHKRTVEPRRAWAATAVLAVLVAGPALAQDKEKTKESYAVVLTKKSAKDAGACSVMASAEVKPAIAENKKAYLEAMKAWTKEKAAFAKDKANRGKKFTKPKPEPTVIRVLKDKVKTQEQAQKMAEAYQAKLEKTTKKKKK